MFFESKQHDTMLSLLLLLLVSAAGQVYVSSSAEFSDLKPAPGATYQYLWYVRASNSTWDCMETPGVCTSNCGFVLNIFFLFS